MADRVTTRCTHCGTEFTDEQLEGLQSCPKCGTRGTPCAIADDVMIKVNWHELRLLGMWADNWAHTPNFPEDSQRVIAAILTRIEAQFPDKTPLTLAGEVRQLQAEYPTLELADGKGNVIVPPKKVQ